MRAIALLLIATPALANEGPQFEAIEDLPLMGVRADVSIAGVVAHVRLRQTYRNRGSAPIEARYTFPASTQAAISRLSMQIGSRRIEAHIEERGQARETYETAKSSGRS